jgi:hypothetical protein
VMISARDLIRVLRFPLQEVSDWISLARPSHLDYGAVAEVSLYVAGGSCEVSHSSIHPSAWNRNSANFVFWGFSELPLYGVLRSSHVGDSQNFSWLRSNTYEQLGFRSASYGHYPDFSNLGVVFAPLRGRYSHPTAQGAIGDATW